MKHRPIGVTIIAILLWIESVLEIVGGILIIVGAFALGHAVSGSGHTTTGTVLDSVGIVVAVIPIIIGILTFIFAVGLWQLRAWAFWLTVIVEIINVIRNVIQLIQPSHGSTGLIIANMVIPVLILLYFVVDANVRKAFIGQ